MRKFIQIFKRIDSKTLEPVGWREIIGNYCYNPYGGKYEYNPTPNDVIATALDWQDLDWSFLIKPDSKWGWVDIYGTFYGCAHGTHDDVAEFHFGMSEEEMCSKGWIKIFRDYNHKATIWYDFKCGFMTTAQINTLKSLELDEYIYEEYE